MQQKDYITKLLGFQGFFVTDMEIRRERDIDKVILILDRIKGRHICSGCGKELTTYYDSRIQEIRHLHLFKYLTILLFEKVRVKCPTCGVKVERLEFIDKYARVTQELSHQTSELCKVMSIEDVSTFQSLHWQTVKEIDKEAIEKAQGERDLTDITVLGVDELSVGAGQSNYLHMISSLEGANGSEVLYVGNGRKEKDLEPFWEWFGEGKAKKITHGVMDMAKGFINSFRAHCPAIKIISTISFI